MRIVVALGGNALGETPTEQRALVKETAKSLADIVEQQHDLIIVHGNGPQVGMIHSAFETAHAVNAKIPLIPLPEAGAMSQGYIGFHLQNALRNNLKGRHLNVPISTLVTQTLVDAQDPAFQTPTKPIGRFFTQEEAETLKSQGFSVVEDSGRGYRVVVASPQPLDIVERDTIETLVQSGSVVIAAGGGGIPVIETHGELHSVPAVIDKDLTSARLAVLLQADVFVILTAVPRVAIHFGTPQQRNLEKMTVSEARQYIAEGHFAPGSMLPKVEAAMGFVEANPQAQAIIASLEEAALALKGKSGTVVYQAV